jgi:hypothetical protein
MDSRHASCHEAGHVVVALALDFRVDGIEVFEGRFRTMCQLDAKERTNEERFILLAGGIAGEKSDLGNYDPGGCADDQKVIYQLGGKAIETYLADAAGIIELRKKCFRDLRNKIRTRAIEKSVAMSVSRSKNSFNLLSSDEIQQIWKD